MIRPTPEWQLLAVVAALYLQDAALLLRTNEGILTQSALGSWCLQLGTTQLQLFGKNLWFPRLFSMHRPVFRMSWNFEETPSPLPGEWTIDTKPYQLLGRLCIVISFFEFILFPWVMLRHQTDVALLLVMALIYGSMFLAMGLLWHRRVTFGLNGRKWIALCFECVVCPPLAVNLVRRLSLNRYQMDDLTVVAQRMLTQPNWQQATLDLQARLKEQMLAEPEGSGQYERLHQRHVALNSTSQSNERNRNIS